MKGLSVSIRMVLVTIVTFVVAIAVIGVGMTGTAGEILRDGSDNAESSGCDFQLKQFDNGNGNLQSLDEQCMDEDTEEIRISMKTGQDNVELIRCMNSYVEENGNSNGISDIEC